MTITAEVEGNDRFKCSKVKEEILRFIDLQKELGEGLCEKTQDFLIECINLKFTNPWDFEDEDKKKLNVLEYYSSGKKHYFFDEFGSFLEFRIIEEWISEVVYFEESEIESYARSYRVFIPSFEMIPPFAFVKIFEFKRDKI